MSASPIRIALLLAAALLTGSSAPAATGTRLDAIASHPLSDGRVQLDFTFAGSVTTPTTFHTDHPARIVLDLQGVTNGLEHKSLPPTEGPVRRVHTVEAGGRTRVVLELDAPKPYVVDVAGQGLRVIVGEAVRQGAPPLLADQRIERLDFQRGEQGAGRVLITLNNPNIVAQTREEAGRIVVRFANTRVPPHLQKRLDVTDFATPVLGVETRQDQSHAEIAVRLQNQDYSHLSTQTGTLLTLEFHPLTPAERQARAAEPPSYTGDKLSLNFQDIPVRGVLQVLADFTGLNIIASDSVQGNLTLRLNDVPWDQALDVVLKTKGLAKRQEGSVVRIVPAEEIHKLESEEVAQRATTEQLEPLALEFILIKYAKAEDIKKVLLVEETKQVSGTIAAGAQNQPQQSASWSAQTSASNGDKDSTLLSARGTVSVDARTNTLIVRDAPSHIERIRALIARLDVPVRQVLIESRIVIANDDFSRDLGAKFGARQTFHRWDDKTVTTQSSTTSDGTEVNNGATLTYPDGSTIKSTGGETSQISTTRSFSQTLGGLSMAAIGGAMRGKDYNGQIDPANLLVDLAAAHPYGAMGLTLLRVGDYLLDLELSAMQVEKRGEILSNPRLLTSDGSRALIKQGRQIPYQAQQSGSGSSSGSTTVSFKDAVLLLEVTPHIAPNDKVVMELKITKDDVGEIFTSTNGNQNPSIDKRELNTTVQVDSGETVVLGGVYEENQSRVEDKVPFFGDLPVVGTLFKRTSRSDKKRELLIFITPRVLHPDLTRAP